MITKSQFSRIRRLHFEDHVPIREIARRAKLSRNTVSKWIYAPSGVVPKYQRAARPRLVDSFAPWLRQELEADVGLPKRERRTAIELHAEMRQQGFAGGYTRVTEFIRDWRSRQEDQAKDTAQSVNKQCWMEWLYSVEQPHRIANVMDGKPPIQKICDILNPSPNSPRTKALVVLAKLEGFTLNQIARHLGINRATAQHYWNAFESGGESGLFAGRLRPRKSQDPSLQKAVFALLHEPPSLHGFNRTTWKVVDLRLALDKAGYSVSDGLIRAIIKDAGYRWKSARVVLTSNDPEYREKYQHIQEILSSLKDDERFFSIDEFGPFAVKMKAGRVLAEPGAQPTVPQWQKSKGWLILTAALELSRNQVSHFYSRAKNTDEMIRMVGILIEQYRETRKLYISWDAASWHVSKRLTKYIEDHNGKATTSKLPVIELAPLPASAQFLNVIESVFSGMARAIIHNSDYDSTKAAMAAIDRYFQERNQHFLDNPRRAGNKIWGKERTSAEFSPSNNCKDPAYR